jgi:hypothetical protein
MSGGNWQKGQTGPASGKRETVLFGVHTRLLFGAALVMGWGSLGRWATAFRVGQVVFMADVALPGMTHLSAAITRNSAFCGATS